MLFWLIPLFLIVLSVIVLAIIIARKIPQLRVTNIEDTVKTKTKRIKEAIIVERLKRLRGTKLEHLYKQGENVAANAMKFGRRSVQKLKALEQYYQELKEAPSGGNGGADAPAVDRMMKDAAELIREEKFGAAEKKYVEIISHDSKNVRAYEELGRLYIRTKKPEQARETFDFILSFKPDDASVTASLGEIALAEDDLKTALGYFERAVTKRPNNPKYLDFFIDTALRLEEIEPARRGIDQLRAANPENKKLEDFEQKIKDISVTPKSKSLQKE
jgi:tetratricopeptide (TPR) repeat protein